MRWFFPTTFLFFLAGCEPEEPVANDPPPPTKEELRARNLKIAALLNEKQELIKQLDRLITQTQLDPEGQIAALESDSREAQNQFFKLRQEHPLLLKLNADIAHWQGLARSASSQKRPEAETRAKAKITELRGTLSQVSRSLPEFAALEQRIRQNDLAMRDLRHSLAAATPEGQQIVDRIEEIDAEINE